MNAKVFAVYLYLQIIVDISNTILKATLDSCIFAIFHDTKSMIL